MALEINAQYVKFVQFAQQQENATTSKVIARVSGEADALDGRNITAADNDKVGPLFKRSQDKKDANNTVRALFWQSIVDMFGGENKIPDSVKKAMLLKDYGTEERPLGKPLTARRIMAVKAAVDVYLGRIAPALERAKANAAPLYTPPINDPAPEERRNTVDSLLDKLVRATAIDKDALDVAVAGAGKIPRHSNSTLLSLEQVQTKADNILAAVAELRAATKGDRAAFEAGKAFIIALNGKNVPEGFMRDMVNAAKRLNMNAMKGLSASSSGPDIHKAVCEFWDNVDKVTNAAGAKTKFDGADEMLATRDFAAALMMARCSDKVARNIAAAMSGAKAGVLNAFYLKVAMEQFPKQGISKGLVQHAGIQGARMRQMISTLNFAAQVRLGTVPEEVVEIPNVDNPDYRTINSQEVLSLIMDRGRTAATEQKAELARTAVTGEGPLADKLRGLYIRFGGPEAFEPEKRLATMRNNIIRSMLNGSMCEECKKLAGPNPMDSQFGKDLDRNPFVKLPNGQQLENHSFDGARDQLAAFVTNGAKTTYASLDDVEKGKTHILMAMLNQKTLTPLESGETVALDPDGLASQIQVTGPRTWEFSVAFKQDGTLSVTCKLVIANMHFINIPGENGAAGDFIEDINPATKIEMACTLEIKADEFERLALLNYSKCDTAAIDRMIADPNVTAPHSKYGQALGEDFALKTANSKVTCTSSCKITVA